MPKSENSSHDQADIQMQLDTAVQFHNAGRLQEAAEVYETVLDVSPQNATALHLLGVIAYQVGDTEQALVLIKESVSNEPTYVEAHCNLGLVYKGLGKMEDAVSCYRRAIELNPGHVQAHNNLGNVFEECGEFDDAARCYRQALALAPTHVNALSNLGVVLTKLGLLDDAIESCRKAIKVAPENADGHSNLGLALLEAGKMEEATDCFCQSLEIDPEDPETHNNLGNALRELERLDEATASYERALELAPNFVDAQNNLGNLYQELERYADAASCFRAVLAVDSENVDAHNNLGLVLLDQRRFEDAVSSFQKAIAIDPRYASAHSNLGFALNVLGDSESALRHFEEYVRLTRGLELDEPIGKDFDKISKAKIDHDIEQFRYLQNITEKTEYFAALAEDYETLRNQIAWPQGDEYIVSLSDSQRQAIQSSYNRPVNIQNAPRVAGTALRRDIDAVGITRQYFDTGPGMTYFDDILDPNALESLRRYLLESTIWYDFRYRGGYLGAFLNEGLCCPLILQIAEEFRQTFPGIFKDHKLQECWAYKYDSEMRGIDVHADAAAVNVNFWITPDSANLNPEGGGLVVHKVEAPLDWRFKAFNMDQMRIRKFLTENDCGQMKVPYVQNRVVLFNSDLFHETDLIEFKPGYENRRINVTMLFGHRQDE